MRSYTAEAKLKVIKRAEGYGTRDAALKYGVNERTIRKWKVQKQKLSSCERTRRSFRGCKPKWTEVEVLLKEWVVSKRSAHRRVSTMMIRKEGLRIADQLGLEDFTGGSHWCHSFMRRNGFSMRARTSVGQPLPDNYQGKIKEFRHFVMEETQSIPLSNVGNVDEVPVPFDVISNRTVDIRATGEKLKPIIIFKRKTMPKVHFPDGVIVKVNDKGWMNETLMKDWIDECWNERQSYDPNPVNSMIILDSARCHLTDNVREEMKQCSKVAVIPGGLTKFLQPLDISVNKPFKENLRNCWEEWMSATENAEYTRGGKRKRPGYEVVAEWVKTSFEAVSTDTIIHGFDKALLENPDLDALNTSF
ncbi:hypothetical protein FO519_010133, partial [Halicephalobus sp. NKZ332]